ncbi:hypothetical protein [Allosphingosinicella vermicomposti]|uniref:hypothetical protein n=1 Tax=Allosphingosinicella vermicomposti TaxID=614671 RepID=UPI00131A53EA|nr:hypothetical protein [Allosphingosinicella vermicomposti]
MDDDLEFYAKRAGEELRAAADAPSVEARQRHRLLAQHYAMLIEQAAARDGEVGGNSSS